MPQRLLSLTIRATFLLVTSNVARVSRSRAAGRACTRSCCGDLGPGPCSGSSSQTSGVLGLVSSEQQGAVAPLCNLLSSVLCGPFVGALLMGTELLGPAGNREETGKQGAVTAPQPQGPRGIQRHEQTGLFVKPYSVGGKTAPVSWIAKVRGWLFRALPGLDPFLPLIGKSQPGCARQAGTFSLLCRIPAPLVAPSLVLLHLAAREVFTRWWGGWRQ